MPAFVSSSLAGRLGTGVLPIAMILAVSAKTGSYAVAGTCSGAFGVCAVVLAPARTRLANRTPFLGFLGLGAGLAAVSVAIAVTGRASPLVLVTLAGVAGCVVPPWGALTKTGLAAAFVSPIDPEKASRQVQVAYSFDTVIDIVVLTGAPLLVAGLMLVSSALAAIEVASSFIIAGAAGFAVFDQNRKAAPDGADAAGKRALRKRRVLRRPGMAQTVISMGGVGGMLGVIEVSIPAALSRQHHADITGIVLAILFSASSAAGLWYGRHSWKIGISSRYTIFVAALTVSCLPLVAAIHDPIWLAVTVVLPGIAFGPTLISAYLAVEKASAVEDKGTANTWINMANNSGASLGLGLGGIVLDRFGISAGIMCAAIIGFLTIATVTFPQLKQIGFGRFYQRDD